LLEAVADLGIGDALEGLGDRTCQDSRFLSVRRKGEILDIALRGFAWVLREQDVEEDGYEGKDEILIHIVWSGKKYDQIKTICLMGFVDTLPEGVFGGVDHIEEAIFVFVGFIDGGEGRPSVHELSVHEDKETLTRFQIDASADREEELTHGEFLGHEVFVLGDLR